MPAVAAAQSVAVAVSSRWIFPNPAVGPTGLWVARVSMCTSRSSRGECGREIVLGHRRVVTVTSAPTRFEVCDPDVLLRGTKAGVVVGDLLTPTPSPSDADVISSNDGRPVRHES